METEVSSVNKLTEALKYIGRVWIDKDSVGIGLRCCEDARLYLYLLSPSSSVAINRQCRYGRVEAIYERKSSSRWNRSRKITNKEKCNSIVELIL